MRRPYKYSNSTGVKASWILANRCATKLSVQQFSIYSSQPWILLCEASLCIRAHGGLAEKCFGTIPSASWSLFSCCTHSDAIKSPILVIRIGPAVLWLKDTKQAFRLFYSFPTRLLLLTKGDIINKSWRFGSGLMCKIRVGAIQQGNMAKGNRRALIFFNRISGILITPGKWTPKD
jgi:hypothetical protein